MAEYDPTPSVSPAGRIVAGVFGLAFAGIGLAILGFMWLSPRDSFHAPPLFFRVFASFIALPFIAVGGAAVFGAITGRPLPKHRRTLTQNPSTAAPATAPRAAGGYRCPHCGAPLGADADVSPSGDVKCPFCNTWFNTRHSAT